MPSPPSPSLSTAPSRASPPPLPTQLVQTDSWFATATPSPPPPPPSKSSSSSSPPSPSPSSPPTAASSISPANAATTTTATVSPPGLSYQLHQHHRPSDASFLDATAFSRKLSVPSSTAGTSTITGAASLADSKSPLNDVDSSRCVGATSATAGTTTQKKRRSVVSRMLGKVRRSTGGGGGVDNEDDDDADAAALPADSSEPSASRAGKPEKIGRGCFAVRKGAYGDLPTQDEIDSMYPGDPHPPVSWEELKAFYIYSFAVEPMVVVVFTALAPLIQQSLAAAYGYEVNDRSRRCDYTVDGYACVVQIGSLWVDVSSFSFYTTAVSVAMQAILFISLGALADHGALRKRFMIGFMIPCVLCCVAFLSLRQASYFGLSAILVIFANVCFGASMVFYNAYIPLLARAHKSVLKVTDIPTSTEAERYAIVDASTNTLSTMVAIYGYIGSVSCFAFVGIFVIGLGQLPGSTGFGVGGYFDDANAVSTYAECFAVALAGCWAFVGMYWPLRFVRPRPGPQFPKGKSYVFYSWMKLGQTLKRIRKLPNTFLLLLSWFILSDALTTVASVTILFARNELGFSSTELIILAIGAPITCAVGNYFWLYFQRRYHWSTKGMLLLVLTLNLAVPVYGMIGLIDAVPFGLKKKWELFPVGIYYGALLGGINSFFRVLYSELVPEGQESEFFALYSITDKGSSWFGPLVVGAITSATHRISNAWIFLIFMLGIPVILIHYVDVHKGKKEVEAVSTLATKHRKGEEDIVMDAAGAASA